MIHGGRRSAALLFVGDLVTFVVALWGTLLLRYLAFPSRDLFFNHLVAFAPLFLLWIVVFYLSGLYGKRIILFKSSLPNALLKTQFFNIVIAALFFFLVPGIGIAPKTNLIIYLGVSLALIFIWRLQIYPRTELRRLRYRSMLIADGEESEELNAEVNGNGRYHLTFTARFSPSMLDEIALASLARELEEKKIAVIVVDMQHPRVQALLPQLYALSDYEAKYQLLDFTETYEEVFDRIPLSLLQDTWFVEQAALETSGMYAVAKRIIDIVGALMMALVTIIATPFVWIALTIEFPGPIFLIQHRIGEHGVHIKAYKFRSMKYNDAASGSWVGERGDNAVTRTGEFLRRVSLDEFPQFINILKGEISLIGPRNDTEGLAKRLADALPYYNMRYSVRPGITGWAQINQQYEPGNLSPQSIQETKMRLAYDFYYIKHRSLALDLVIALKTVKRMFFRVSSW